MQPLPGPLRLPSPSPFVGRSAELAALRVLIPREAGERGRLALLGGEAGSGKSRLVRELAHEVAGVGVLVLYGACDAVVQTAYRPFAEALDPSFKVYQQQVIDNARAMGDSEPNGC